MGESEENLDAALADYEMALEINETITEAYIRMADVYIMQGQYDKAKAILQRGLGKAEEEQYIIDRLENIPENTIYIHSIAELEETLGSGISDCTLVLDGIDYNIEFLFLYGLENVVVQGTEGTRILGSDEEDEVIEICDCKGLTLKNLVIGHDIPAEWSCTSGVLGIYGSGVSFINCDIFGCGKSGFYACSSIIEAENTIAIVRNILWTVKIL